EQVPQTIAGNEKWHSCWSHARRWCDLPRNSRAITPSSRWSTHTPHPEAACGVEARSASEASLTACERATTQHSTPHAASGDVADDDDGDVIVEPVLGVGVAVL